MSGHQTTSYFLIFLFIFVANSQITPGNNLHAFLTSSYYYPKSQSLGDDSIALVFSMRSESIRRQSQILTIFAENHTSNATINTTIEIPNGKTTFPIFPTTSTLPNMTKLSLLDGQQKIELKVYLDNMKHIVVLRSSGHSHLMSHRCEAPMSVSSHSFLHGFHLS
ncbi:unnamed protein product [Caenorhabditis bovis]|uniref:Uncharacterized protein n=1 Tax=Caenorhabditis bovis TaxID=2654633 RepID=A0A8S1EYN8_9PELO|nr:unnamed protein product [Caenorhabditis bovis]